MDLPCRRKFGSKWIFLFFLQNFYGISLDLSFNSYLWMVILNNSIFHLFNVIFVSVDPNNYNAQQQQFRPPAAAGGADPMPQLQQLMMLLQQNQQSLSGQNSAGNNSSFGPGFMQAAQMLAQSQNQMSQGQSSRFESNQIGANN